MTKFVVIEIDLMDKEYRHKRVHVFNLPSPSEKGFYRETTSFNAFFNGVPKGNRLHGPNQNSTTLYNAKRWIEFEETCERQAKLFVEKKLKGFPDDRLLPRVEHQNIWDFYQKIGYDYKKKRYIKE
jgi:hypothetical protein